jgi:hypothetical protein
VLSHLALQLDDMTQLVGLPGVGAIIGLIHAISKSPKQLAITHVLPLLGNRGLNLFADVLAPWLYEMATDAKFREILLTKLVNQFPVSNRKSAMTFLKMIQHVSVAVPKPLVSRVLAILASCLVRDDKETTAKALAVFTSRPIAMLLDSMTVMQATPMLKTLFVHCANANAGAHAHEKKPNDSVSGDALTFVSMRRRQLVREFARQFRDSEAECRATWVMIGRAAMRFTFTADVLASDPTVLMLAGTAGAASRVLQQCG